MPPRLLDYADVETALDDPDRAGRLAGTLRARDGPDAAVVGAGDLLAPGVLAMVTDERAERSDGPVALWLQFSGLSSAVDGAGAVRDVRVDGEALEPFRDYRLAAPGYVWHSEEFPAVDPGDREETWGPQYETVVEHVRERGLAVAVDGRVRFQE